MEFTKEFIEANGFNEDQTKVLSSYFSEESAKIKLEYDGKANENAENILTGAATKIHTDTGVERERGEKIGDYIIRANAKFNESKISELTKVKSEYEDKIKNFKGSDETKAELTKAKEDNDKLLQKFADYETLKEKADKFEPLSNQYNSMKLEVAFSKVKPNFPDEVNKYEADVKWNALKNDILSKYDIEIVDGEAKAISKENKHSVVNLSDLVNKDENITILLKGRQQGGTGAKQANFTVVEGVPFKVPENATPTERTTLIREYLATQGVKQTSSNYATEFAKINSAILKIK